MIGGCSMMGLVVGTATLFLAATLADAGELDVRAELDSYNLMIPKPSYCCAFRLHLDPAGRVELELEVPDPDLLSATQREAFAASKETIAGIRSAIESARFFDLPPHIDGITGFHPDRRSIEIRLGERSHRVVLTLMPGQSCEAESEWGVADEDKDRIRRACSVWRQIRALVTHPQAVVP